jgi:hypothetical protein
VQLSEEKSVKTTINIKKENIISVGRVINMDKLVNKDFYNIIKNKVFVFTDFSSDNCTYHSLGIAFFSRLNSLKKIILFFNFSIK